MPQSNSAVRPSTCRSAVSNSLPAAHWIAVNRSRKEAGFKDREARMYLRGAKSDMLRGVVLRLLRLRSKLATQQKSNQIQRIEIEAVDDADALCRACLRHHVGRRLHCDDATAKGKSEKGKVSNLVRARVRRCDYVEYWVTIKAIHVSAKIKLTFAPTSTTRGDWSQSLPLCK